MRESPGKKRENKDKTTVRKGSGAFFKGLQIGAVITGLGAGAQKTFAPYTDSEDSIITGTVPENNDQAELDRMVREIGAVPMQGFDQRYFSEEQLKCLTDNLYHEARGEPIQGRYGVVFATLERVLHKEFPKSICGVVYQPWQFSWTRDQKILAAPINPKEYLQMSVEVYTLLKGRTLEEASVEAGLKAGLPRGSIYYKDFRFTGSEKVQRFFSSLVRVGQIGTHEFFIDAEPAQAAKKKTADAPKVAINSVPLPRPSPLRDNTANAQSTQGQNLEKKPTS